MSAYSDESGTRTFANTTPGHVIDLTVMSGGGIRTECSCGFWEDVQDDEMSLAIRHAQVHNRNSRQATVRRDSRSWGPFRAFPVR